VKRRMERCVLCCTVSIVCFIENSSVGLECGLVIFRFVDVVICMDVNLCITFMRF
jgi:hypothetical protein